MSRKGRKKLYDKEFKLNAVKMLERGDITLTQLAHDLDVNINTLANWKKKYLTNAEKAFLRTPDLTDEQKRIRELERKLKESELENQILKKAVAIFAEESK